MVNYVIPLAALAVTYARVGNELWGSQAVGERTPAQDEAIKAKRKVMHMVIDDVYISQFYLQATFILNAFVCFFLGLTCTYF